MMKMIRRPRDGTVRVHGRIPMKYGNECRRNGDYRSGVQRFYRKSKIKIGIGVDPGKQSSLSIIDRFRASVRRQLSGKGEVSIVSPSSHKILESLAKTVGSRIRNYPFVSLEQLVANEFFPVRPGYLMYLNFELASPSQKAQDLVETGGWNAQSSKLFSTSSRIKLKKLSVQPDDLCRAERRKRGHVYSFREIHGIFCQWLLVKGKQMHPILYRRFQGVLTREDIEDVLSDFYAKFASVDSEWVHFWRLERKVFVALKNDAIDLIRGRLGARRGGRIPHQPLDELPNRKVPADDNATPFELIAKKEERSLQQKFVQRITSDWDRPLQLVFQAMLRKKKAKHALCDELSYSEQVEIMGRKIFTRTALKRRVNTLRLKLLGKLPYRVSQFYTDWLN